MTDVPRRAYPLVVAPPGGFEDAVRRGRSMRRRKAGGTTGAALALVGAIAYSTMGGTNGTSGLQPTNDLPRREITAPGIAGQSPSPEPSATISPSPQTSPGNPVATGGPGSVPSYVPPGDGPTEPPVREPGKQPPPTVPYAKRAAIQRMEPMPSARTDTSCLPTSGNLWCAEAYAQDESTPSETRWRLSYTLCRSVNAIDPGVVTFDRRQQANFATTKDERDTLWTYSKGQPVVADSDEVEVPPGYCVEWYTYWDGQDDWGYTGGPGKYSVTSSSMGTSDTGLPSDTYDFEIK